MNDYNTDILKLTCSCPDWIEIRQQYKLNDPRRLCKHIINKLDMKKLPLQIAKFKETIAFFQEKKRGFENNFDEIIEIDTFTLLGNSGWINVYDEDGIRYGVLIEPFSKNIYWAKKQKPKNFSVIENFLINKSKKTPLPLEEGEHPQIINFIKDVLPHKKDFFLSINSSQYIPNSDGIIYSIWESRLTPEEEKKLEKELLQKYNTNEAYYKLGEARSVPIDEEKDFCIYEPIRVTNDEITITMYSGKKYKLKRNYNYVKQLEKARILETAKQEELWAEELEKEMIRKSILEHYDTVQNLIKQSQLNITTVNFNKALKNLNFITKESSLNRNNWIIKDKGLEYGVNLIKKSKFINKEIPDWYKVHTFDYKTVKLLELKQNMNTKITSAIFEKNKFNELVQLVEEEIKNRKINHPIKDTKKPISNKRKEREKWLRHITCPNCEENTNIHKKDKRTRRAGYTIQRFYCNECNSMFQVDFDELEKLIQEYHEKNSIL